MGRRVLRGLSLLPARTRHDPTSRSTPTTSGSPWRSPRRSTTRITLGTMVTPLPARKPASVAAQALTVDHLSAGRLVLAVGLGDDEPQQLRRARDRLDTLRGQRRAAGRVAWRSSPGCGRVSGCRSRDDTCVSTTPSCVPEPLARPRIPGLGRWGPDESRATTARAADGTEPASTESRRLRGGRT